MFRACLRTWSTGNAYIERAGQVESPAGERTWMPRRLGRLALAIAVLSVTPGLMARYLTAATKVSRLAVGDTAIRPISQIYRVAEFARLSQQSRAAISQARHACAGRFARDEGRSDRVVRHAG